MIVGGWFADPPPEARLKRIWEGPGVRSCQTTLILPFLSTATCSASDKPASLERFCGVGENVVPPSTERAKKMSPLTTVLSSQATLTLPPASSAICGRLELEPPRPLERFLGIGEKVVPLSVERLEKMSKWPGLSFSQTTLILPPRSTAICGLLELPILRERDLSAGKVAPLSAERLKEMSEWPAVSSSQTTLMLPFSSSAMRGLKEKPELLERFLGVENVVPPSVERLNRIFELA